MAENRRSSVVSVCSAVVWLWWVVSAMAIEGRVVPLLQSCEKSGFRSTFSAIYDTSKYGILQLSNGLAGTPQMGFVSFRLSLSFSLSFFMLCDLGYLKFMFSFEKSI
jgi:hypothetical protein